jgi:hypothetical protein
MSETPRDGGRVLQPAGWAKPSGYSHGLVASGRQVVLAGQVGWNPLTAMIETDDFTEQTRQAIDDHLAKLRATSGDFLFPGRQRDHHLTTRQYARLLSEWLSLIGLDPSAFGTHSVRRTKATLIYRKTGNLRAVQLLLGHTKIESTVRYLGIEVDDALASSDQVDV